MPRSPLDDLYEMEEKEKLQKQVSELAQEVLRLKDELTKKATPPTPEPDNVAKWIGKHPKRKWLNGINTKHFVATFLDKVDAPELEQHADKLETLFSAALAYCEQKLDEQRKETRLCQKCQTKKTLDCFRTKQTWCKTCLSEKEAKQRSSPADKIRRTNYQREYMRKYRAANPEREAKTVLKSLSKNPGVLMTQHPGMVSLNQINPHGRTRVLGIASDLPPDEAMMLAEEQSLAGCAEQGK